ncbi:MAG TPA: hypothetical protein PKC72_13100 [Chitinophagaceae bacterium]|nr:hypothetical protein [Chitinophagaceae bacterium]
MKASVFHGLVFLAFCFIAAGCNGKDGKKDRIIVTRFFEVKRIDCESNVELCNRKPGLKFTALAPKVEDNRPNWRLELRVQYEPEPYTLTICCDTIPSLIDSLKMMHDTLEHYRTTKPERGVKTCNLPDSLSIYITYRKNFLESGEWSCLEFGKPSEGTVFFVHTKEQFDKLIHDIEERFRTCCLN